MDTWHQMKWRVIKEEKNDLRDGKEREREREKGHLHLLYKC